MSDLHSDLTSDLALPSPVSVDKRIVPMDVLRGLALLGILSMNIRNFAMVLAAYPIPTAFGDLHGANYAAFYVTALLCDSKFMAIFSMLFGAGVVLMSERQERAERDPWKLHCRRMLVLLVFGLAHAWLLWAGDILYTYALCGLIVFWFRRVSPIGLFALGFACLAVGSLVTLAAYWFLGENDAVLAEFQPSAAQIAEEVAAYQGGWWQQCAFRWKQAFVSETVEFVSFLAWRAGGMMFIGMALYRLGVLHAGKPAWLYLTLVGVGIFVGLPVIAWGIHLDEASRWDTRYVLLLGSQYNYWGSVPVALGWLGLVMLLWRAPFCRVAMYPLAAVGRMALSNYLLQTLICTTVFYGHGLGWFGRLERVEQFGIVAAVWVFQLMASPLWLRYFRFGPAEWLWRSLTYGTCQPIRCAACVGRPS